MTYGPKENVVQSEFNVATKIDDESDYVRDGDLIQIDTVNHSYQFAVKNRDAKRGLLKGGALGEGEFTATLSSSLQRGYGASFKVWLNGSLCRLMTSDVLNLVCIRRGERSPGAIMKFPSLNCDTGNVSEAGRVA